MGECIIGATAAAHQLSRECERVKRDEKGTFAPQHRAQSDCADEGSELQIALGHVTVRTSLAYMYIHISSSDLMHLLLDVTRRLANWLIAFLCQTMREWSRKHFARLRIQQGLGVLRRDMSDAPWRLLDLFMLMSRDLSCFVRLEWHDTAICAGLEVLFIYYSEWTQTFSLSSSQSKILISLISASWNIWIIADCTWFHLEIIGIC